MRLAVVSVRVAVERVLLRVETHTHSGRRRCQQRTDCDAQVVHPVPRGVRNSSWSAKAKARFVAKRKHSGQHDLTKHNSALA
eukprot:scaffold142738_cov136-Phaeocystis_antarctica.AAC.4